MNNDLIIKRGAADKIAEEPVVDGALLLDKESGALYADIGNKRLEVGAVAKNDAVFESNVTVQKNATVQKDVTIYGNADVKGAVVAASIVAKSDAELGDTSCANLTANSATCTDLNSDNATCKNLTVGESMAVNAPYFSANRIDGTSVNLPSEDGFLVNETSFKSLLLNAVYPIGSLYWTKDANFDPNKKFGGYWVRIEGAFIYAAREGDTVGDVIKGEKEHNHSEGNLSARIGSAYQQAQTLTFHADNTWVESEREKGITGMYTIRSNDLSYGQNEQFSHYTSVVGRTDDASKMPPYLSRYCWERREPQVDD